MFFLGLRIPAFSKGREVQRMIMIANIMKMQIRQKQHPILGESLFLALAERLRFVCLMVYFSLLS